MESRPKEESDRESQGVEENSGPQAPDYGSTPSTRNKGPEEVVGTATEAGKSSTPAAGSDEDSDEEYDPADDDSYLQRLYGRPPPPSPKPRFDFDVDPYGAGAAAKSDPIDRVEHTESGLRTRVPLLLYNLPDQHFKGPRKGRGPYASVSILDPVITVERHHRKYYIAARLNIETTILGYDQHESDDHEWFFQDICLQYKNEEPESFVMKPESDPAVAFTVTRSSNSTVSGQAGISGSGIPAANVSLGISRSSELRWNTRINIKIFN